MPRGRRVDTEGDVAVGSDIVCLPQKRHVESVDLPGDDVILVGIDQLVVGHLLEVLADRR